MTHKNRYAWRLPSIILTVILAGMWLSSQVLAQAGADSPNCPSDADVWVIHSGHYIWHSWLWFSDQAEAYREFEARAAELNGYDSPRPFWSLPAGALVCIPEVPGYEYEQEGSLTAAETDSLAAVIDSLEAEAAQLSQVTAENEQLKEQLADRDSGVPWWILLGLLFLAALAYIVYQRHSHQAVAREHKEERARLQKERDRLDKERDKLEEKLEQSNRQIALMTDDGKFSPTTVSAMVEVSQHYAVPVEMPEELHPRGFVDVLKYPYPHRNNNEPWVIIPGAAQPVKRKNRQKYILENDESRKAYKIPTEKNTV